MPKLELVPRNLRGRRVLWFLKPWQHATLDALHTHDNGKPIGRWGRKAADLRTFETAGLPNAMVIPLIEGSIA
jgi:hypothetical protein